MICEFAGICFEIEGILDSTKLFLKDFSSDKEPEETLRLSEADFKRESEISGCADRKMLEITALYRKISEIAPMYGAFLMHAAVIEADNKGIAFTASSGTGKTTHMQNWIKAFKKRVRIVNGDKPLIRLESGKFFAYPTPWCGKEKLKGTDKCELSAVCFIKRAKENETLKISKKAALRELLNRIYIPQNEELSNLTFSLLDKFLEKSEFYDIFCNTDENSANCAYNSIFKEEKI